MKGPDKMSVQRSASHGSQAAADLVSDVLKSLGDGRFAPASVIRNAELIRGFAAFGCRSEANTVSGLTSELANTYIHSLTRSGAEPSIATMRLRRSALRLLFREARTLGLVDHDPTLGIELPRRTYSPVRPLTDAEISTCRSFAETLKGDSRFSAAWGLSEASARVAELSSITSDDIADGAVALAGCSSTDSRVVGLTEWGKGQVDSLLNAFPGRRTDRLFAAAPRGSLHELVAATLRRAGLGGKPGVNPNSVAAWRGASELAKGATIDEVARLLGMRSLDRTAAFIGFDWRKDV